MAKRRVYSNRRLHSSRRPRESENDVSRYNNKTLTRDREYGFYWYSWLWTALRPVLIFVCSALIVLGLIATAYNTAYTQLFMAVSPGDETQVEFVIEQNSSISTISKNLEENKLIRNGTIFKTLISLQGLTSKIQYGSYPLSSGMDVSEVIDVLTSGSSVNERTITIIPGWTIEDIIKYLKDEGALKDEAEFRALCNDIDKFKNDYYAVEQAAASGKMSGRIFQLEGYLAPDTYRVFANASAEDLLRTLLKQMDSVIDSVFYRTTQSDIVYDENGNLVEQEPEDRYQSSLSQEETLVLASIIEKEAGKRADYAKVSAVFHTRLNKDMALESDATISYALGIRRMLLTATELSTESIYNTYLNKGLPQGPICNPSKAAIEAALYPDMEYITEEYLYFCATDPATGDLKFSKTKEEHDAAVAEYRPLWEAYDNRQQSGG